MTWPHEVMRSPSGREMRTLSRRSLRRYSCALCGQRLDRMANSPKACSRIRAWDPPGFDGCAWAKHFHEGVEV